MDGGSMTSEKTIFTFDPKQHILTIWRYEKNISDFISCCVLAVAWLWYTVDDWFFFSSDSHLTVAIVLFWFIASIYARQNMLINVLRAIPTCFYKEECPAVLPHALVAGFVKTDKNF
jgi:hypothetical protein